MFGYGRHMFSRTHGRYRSEFDLVVTNLYRDGHAAVYSPNTEERGIIKVSELKEMHKRGVKIKGVITDSIGRVRVYPPTSKDLGRLLGNVENTSATTLTKNAELANAIYNALPELNYDKSSSRQKIALEMAKFANKMNQGNDSISLFKSNGIVCVKWDTDLPTRHGSINVYQVVHVDTSITRPAEELENCVLNPEFSIVCTRTNKVIVNFSIKKELDAEYIRDINTHAEKLNTGHTKVAREAKFRTSKWFKGLSCDAAMDEIQEQIRKVIRSFGGEKIDSVAEFASVYFLEVLYNYSARGVVDYAKFRVYSDNLIVGVEWPMQFEDGTRLMCKIEKNILSPNYDYGNTVVRYIAENGSEASLDMNTVGALYIPVLHLDVYRTSSKVRDINDRLLKRLFKSNAKAYLMQPTLDDIALRNLHNDIGEKYGNVGSTSYTGYSIARQLKGSTPDDNYGYADGRIIKDRTTGLTVKVRIRAGRDPYEHGVYYEVNRDLIAVQKIAVPLEDIMPMTKLCIFTPECLKRVEREVNDYYINDVVPKLRQIKSQAEL